MNKEEEKYVEMLKTGKSPTKPCFKCKKVVQLAYELAYVHPRDPEQVVCEDCMKKGVYLDGPN